MLLFLIACFEITDEQRQNWSEKHAYEYFSVEAEISSEEDILVGTELSCFAQARDVSVPVQYQWFTGEIELGQEENYTISAEEVGVGETIRCLASIVNSEGNEVRSEDAVVLENSQPNFDTEATISPASDYYTGTELFCTASASDADDGELTIVYEWSAGNTILGSGQSYVIDAGVGEDITCRASATDLNEATQTSLAVITVQNSEPQLSEVAIFPDSSVYNDMELTCSATVEDLDEQLSIDFIWQRNGEQIGSGETLDLGAVSALPTQTIFCIASAEDSEGAEVSETVSIIIENREPELFSVFISDQAPEADSSLSCTGSANDPDGETLNLSYSWDIAGTVVGTEEAIILEPSFANVGDDISCTVTVNDGSGGSDSGTTSGVIQNTAPLIDQASISPNIGANTGSILSCSATGSDLNDGTLIAEYEWLNIDSQAIIGTMNSIQLDSSLVSPNDVIQCTATVTDNQGASASSSISVNIDNSPPVFDTPASISPSVAHTGDELSCSAVASDPDGDTVLPSFVWRLNGVEVGSGVNYLITAEDTNVGDLISCSATVEDSLGLTASSSTSVIVENTSPLISGMTIGPDPVYNDSIVNCLALVEDADEEVDVSSISYIWSDANGSLGTGDSFDLATSSLLPQDELFCLIEFTDSEGSTVQETASVIVENRAPSAPTISINSVFSNDDLVCTALSVDPDGQQLSYTYIWTSDTGGMVSGDTVLSSETSFSEIWTCEAQVSDGSLSAGGQDSVSLYCAGGGCEPMSLDLGGGESLQMGLIPAGDDPSGRYTLGSDFYMMSTEVTQGMYYQVMGYQSYDGEATSNGSSSYGVGVNHPAYHVSWHMAADFANTVTGLHNSLNGTSLQECYSCTDSGTTSVSCTEAVNPYQCTGYYIPTEYQWEYAARSGTTETFWTPDGGGDFSTETCDGTETIQDGVSNPFLRDYAWYCGNSNNSYGGFGVKEVGLKLPNGFGLYDMHGNIYEWTADWEGCSLSSVNPYCDVQSNKRYTRSGAYFSTTAQVRITNHHAAVPETRQFYYGFRLAFTP